MRILFNNIKIDEFFNIPSVPHYGKCKKITSSTYVNEQGEEHGASSFMIVITA